MIAQPVVRRPQGFTQAVRPGAEERNPAATARGPGSPNNPSGASWPGPGIALVFTNGTTTLVAKTDSAGAYTIDLPVGTWGVGTANFGRIVDGPQTVVVTNGGSIEADYVVDTGIRAAA